MTTDDEADSLLRAIAAAPAARPVRTLTIMLVRARDDQREAVRARCGGAEVDERTDGLLAVTWAGAEHAERAARCALDLRRSLDGLSIALATGTVEPGQPSAPIIERATTLLDRDAIRVDDDTASHVERRFSVQRKPGEAAVLVEQLGSGTPARIDLTIGNYRIVKELGSGGMGVVYLAEHASIGRKAVIKFVHERLLNDQEFTARFYSEAKLAASIHHPGIVDVFDYGQDARGHGYIVMEHLDGESLRSRIRREGKLPLELVLAITTQVASALGAAHAAGVIHRDLKPDNIFLVRDPGSPHEVRAKVLDFGLAKPMDSGERGLTRSGDFVGTPLYMSPEQARSKAVDRRTDVYSLGCIAFEMACGRVPFAEETIGDLIIAHTSKPAPAPRSLVPSLPAAFDRAVLRALAKSPDDRFPDMAAMTAAFAGVDAGAANRRSWVPARKPLAIAAVGLVLAGTATGWVLTRSHAQERPVAHGPSPKAAASARRSIAVLDPRDESGSDDSAWFGTALGETLTTNLLSSGQLDVTPTTDVARMKTELGIGDATSWSRDELAKVRVDVGAQYVITGSFHAADGQAHVELDIRDTTTGDSIGKVTAAGPVNDPGGVGLKLAQDLERALGVPTDATAAPALALPSRPLAARYYAEGIARLRRFEIIPARDLLDKAAQDSPDDPLIHAALGQTWRELGYDAKAAAEAQLAYDHSAQLPKENRLAIEAQYRESRKEWDQAIEAYRTLFDFFPTRVEYGMALAAAQTAAGDAKGAYATLDNLRKLPQLADDPRIELAEAAAAETADDMERERASAERAVALARPRGARVLLAKALFRQGWALWVLGRDAEAQAAYNEARQIFTDLHDGSGLARCLSNIGMAAHRDHRDADAAKAFDEGLRLATEIGDTTAQTWVLQNWGWMLIDQGDLRGALDLAAKKLELGATRGDSPVSQAGAQINIAEILRLQGDLAGATTHAKAAEDLLRGVDEREFAAFTNDQLGEIARSQDDLAGARRLLAQGIQWASTQHPMIAAECRMSLARTELDQGNAADAEKAAQDALADLQAAHDTRLQPCAIALVATSLLARNRAADAQHALATVTSVADATMACRLDLDLATARALAADPAQRTTALAQIVALAARAADHGYVQRELEIRLAAAELGGDAGALARDAAAKGFKQIARRASKLGKNYRP